MRRIRQDKRGVSNIIVVALGLVIVVAIVVNIVLWSYEMNQHDWEKMKEDVTIIDVASTNQTSSYNPSDNTLLGSTSLVSGDVSNLKSDDGAYMTLRSYSPEAGMRSIEVEFTGSSDTKNWNQLNWTINSAWTIESVNVTLQLYNYTLGGYPINGNGYTAYTSEATPNTHENKSQAIYVNPTHFRNATGHWKMKIKGVKTTDIQFDLKADWMEFKTVKPATLFTFKNEGSPTVHLVSLWINNSTQHQRYNISIFIGSGETESYTSSDIALPNKPCIVKVVTERGNVAIHSES